MAIIIENPLFRLTIGEDCIAQSLVCKANGEECLVKDAKLPLFSVTQERPFNNEVKLATLCKVEACDLVLLSGDLFDGNYTPATYRVVYEALQTMQVPVFISPGNHDFIFPDSPYEKELWPENVHIFKKQTIEWVDLPELSLRVYGPPLLDGLQAGENAVGVFHADPTQVNSPYNPVTAAQVSKSGLRYLALGHVHKGDSFRAGDTLCAWPGCPMGRGWDEEGQKGALIVTLAEDARMRFVPLGAPRFYNLSVEASQGVGAVLPVAASQDYYRVALTGEAESVDLDALQAEFSRFPNLVVRDETVPLLDIWAGAGEDSFEGVYFGILKNALENASEMEKEQILLAARLSRQLLEGQEVALP